MFEQRRTCPEKPLLSAVAVLLLLAAGGRSAVLTDNLQTPETPLSNSSLIPQLNRSSMETPVVLPLHRPCESKHDTYCANGGRCMYPQDSDKPSCICEHSYSGPRCMFVEPSRGLPDVEQVIGIILGIFILIIFLAIAVYFLAWKRCRKSPLPIKSVPSETPV
ncbi:epigen [Archocentrus centrarchus]|uniref:epigen n=1 Tax=Archocentrus centrarchus TaxID=63155 RepID=UPI0011EA2D19|nr:pro-neuregulin-4, membrane-bound isoform-like [Archocentrus centrarchus]